MSMFNNAQVTYIGAIRIMFDLLSVCTNTDIVLTTLEYFEMIMLSEMHLKQCLDQGNWLELFTVFVESMQQWNEQGREEDSQSKGHETRLTAVRDKFASIIQQFIYEDMARPHRLCKMTKLKEMIDMTLFQRYMVAQCVATFQNNARLPVTVATNLIKNLSLFFDQLEDHIDLPPEECFKIIDLVTTLAYENNVDVRTKMKQMSLFDQRDRIIIRLLRRDLDSKHQLQIAHRVRFILHAQHHPFFMEDGMVILLRMLHMASQNVSRDGVSVAEYSKRTSARGGGGGRAENNGIPLLRELAKLIHILVRDGEDIRKIVLKHTDEVVLAHLMDSSVYADSNMRGSVENSRASINSTNSQSSQDEGTDDDDAAESVLAEQFIAWYTSHEQKQLFQGLYQKIEHAWVLLYQVWNERDEKQRSKLMKKLKSCRDDRKNEKKQLANLLQEYEIQRRLVLQNKFNNRHNRIEP